MTAPLVFLPGWCLGRGPLNAAVNALNGTIFDLPGYGESPLPDRRTVTPAQAGVHAADGIPACAGMTVEKQASLPSFYAAADNIAARLQPGTTLCGWSLGAQLALAVAARAPEKVGKLILVAGTVSFIQRDGWPHAMPPAMLAEFTTGILADVEAMLPRFVGGFNRGDARAKEVSRQLLELADPRPPLATLASGLDWLRDVDLRRLVPQIKAPTLLIHGSADPLMPLAAAEALAAMIPQAQLATFADCAHAPFISRPEDFLVRINAFLND